MVCRVEITDPSAVADITGIGRTGWGLAVAASSLGAVAGGVLSLRWRPRRAILVGCALMGLTAMTPLLLALAPYTWLLVVANFVAGVGVEQAGVAWYATLNEQIPEDRLARVYAYDDLGSYFALPLATQRGRPLVTVELRRLERPVNQTDRADHAGARHRRPQPSYRTPQPDQGRYQGRTGRWAVARMPCSTIGLHHP
ncbi:MFS transporter [Streptomyces coeruleorubidus]|uniref:MFS transporter n=1 Tax=Streptomyces coeruleorubidus TaxID=116188 RepID=UPI0033CEE262